MFDKLAAIERRYEELLARLATVELQNDSTEYRKCAKEVSDLEPTVTAFREYQALAQEVARKGVTVNTVSPGYTATDMVMAVPEDIRKQIIAQIPVGRLGKPEEIAYVVDFLCAPEAGFITGADIAANGGQHMM